MIPSSCTTVSLLCTLFLCACVEIDALVSLEALCAVDSFLPTCQNLPTFPTFPTFPTLPTLQIMTRYSWCKCKQLSCQARRKGLKGTKVPWETARKHMQHMNLWGRNAYWGLMDEEQASLESAQSLEPIDDEEPVGGGAFSDVDDDESEPETDEPGQSSIAYTVSPVHCS